MYTILRKYCTVDKNILNNYQFHSNYNDKLKSSFLKNLIIYPNFIDEKEELNLIEEITPKVRRMRYEYDHWDNAIHGFREFESEKWNDKNSAIFQKVHKYAFINDSNYMSSVHVLDLAENGYIKAHLDSVRFCGRTIAGLSLLTDSIMRLISEKDQMTVDILLNRRSLYIMRDFVRYNFTHEILPNEKSIFKEHKILKGRRISLICRSKPNEVSDTS